MSLIINLLVGLILFTSHAEVYANSTNREFAKSVPIVDMHMHLFGKRPIFYKELMDRNGVKWGGGVGGSIFDDQEGVSALLGTRYIKTLGQKEFSKVFFQQGVEGLSNLDNADFKELFKQAEEEFKAGKAYGFGEIHGNNRRTPGGGNQKFARKISLLSPVITKMFVIANQYEKFIQLHIEGDEDTLSELTTQMTQFSNVKVILSHCLPYSSPETLRSLFDKNKNLYCEISAGGPVHKIMRIFNTSGITPRYEQLILNYSERFFLGTDPCCGLENLYDEMIQELRVNFLEKLPTNVAEQIAYKNAQKVLQLKE